VKVVLSSEDSTSGRWSLSVSSGGKELLES